MSSITLTLFGKPAVLYEGELVTISVKKAFALLAFLLTNGKPQSRERLAALLWQDATEEVARTSLRQALHALRETPLAGTLITSRDTVTLAADVESDVQSFRQAVSYCDIESYDTTHKPLPPMTLELVAQLQTAALLYKGDFMEDFNISGSFEWDDWLQLRRIEFHYQATQVFSLLTRYYAERGLIDSGLQMARRWLDLDTYQENAYRYAIYLYALGSQVERALEQYHWLTRLLKREFDRSPEPETQQLYEQIRSGQLLATTPNAAPKKSWRVMLPKPASDTGDYSLAQQQIKQRLGILTGDTPASLLVLYDANSVVAPTLIAQIAHDPEVQALFPDSILWAELENDQDLDAVLRLWLDALRISILKSTRKIEHLAWQLHNGLRDKRVLLLIENLQDERFGRLLTPGYPHSSLVLTTSNWRCARNLVTNADHLIALTPVTPNNHKLAH